MPAPQDERISETPSSEQAQDQPEGGSELGKGDAVPAVGSVFNPESLERMCRHDLSAALRLLADHLDRQ